MLPVVLEHMRSLGYVVFTEADYDLNIFGIRSPDRDSDEFDDLLGCAFLRDGQWFVEYWPATTDPGRKLLENPINKKGAAILCPGQYRGVYKIDKHAGKYDALCQRAGKVTVYRDDNKDNVLDMDESNKQTGMFGINIHKRRGTGSKVNASSAGCQVFERKEDFDRLMWLARSQKALHGWDTYTYTLLDQWW
jgi:hypothetical protein